MNSSLRDWAQLVRVPNTLTSAADVLAGLCLGGGTAYSLLERPVVAMVASLASISLYWGGMVLNDVFDYEEDCKNNRQGPLVRGAIPLDTARKTGFGLLVLGWLLACAASEIVLVESRATGSDWRGILATGAVALALIASIIAYDGPAKKTPLAPMLMGLCRALNMTLGMVIASYGLGNETSGLAGIPVGRWLYPVGLGIYVMGFTISARREFLTEQSRPRLWVGWLTMAFGILFLATLIGLVSSPSLDRLIQAKGESVRWFFPCAMLLLGTPVFRRAWVSIETLRGPDLGRAIGQAIQHILLIDALIAVVYAGSWAGLVIALMVIPTGALGKMFRTT